MTLQLGGDNAASYQLTNSLILITIAAAPALNVTPTQTLTVLDAQKTYARIQVTTNLPGYFYYHMNLAPFTTPYTASAIKAAIKANSLTIESNADYLTTAIYSADRDQRVGFTAITSAGSTNFNLENLLPERSYGLCGYF